MSVKNEAAGVACYHRFFIPDVVIGCVACVSKDLCIGTAPAKHVTNRICTLGQCVEAAVIEILDGAHKQVLVQAYLLTSKKIATALIAAHRRGVAVWLEPKYQNAHNKIIVVDADAPNATVITGSFNFTWTAQHKNAENMLIVRNNPALANRYAQNWERHRADAIPYRKQ